MTNYVVNNLDGDVAFLERLRQRHPRAFCQLEVSYGPGLLGYLTKLVGDEAQAQDLLQETWIKVWLNLHQLDPKRGSLSSWLFRIAHNTALDDLRTNWLRPVRLAEHLQHGGPSILPNDSYLDVLVLVSQLLPAKHYQVIEWLYVQGYTQQETAQGLGLPLGTVKTYARWSLRRLKLFFARE